MEEFKIEHIKIDDNTIHGYIHLDFMIEESNRVLNHMRYMKQLLENQHKLEIRFPYEWTDNYFRLCVPKSIDRNLLMSIMTELRLTYG